MADINIDMIGRNWADTIVAIGKEHSDLGATLERVNARAPGARHDRDRRPLAGGAVLLPLRPLQLRPQGRARSLFFFNGVHEDYHQVTDSPDKIDSEKESRILRLLYYLGQEIGNAAGAAEVEPGELRDPIVERYRSSPRRHR